MVPASIRFPVVCPSCGSEALAAFSVADLCAALLTNDEMLLQPLCHGQTWNADVREREQIREYLAVLTLDAVDGPVGQFWPRVDDKHGQTIAQLYAKYAGMEHRWGETPFYLQAAAAYAASQSMD